MSISDDEFVVVETPVERYTSQNPDVLEKIRTWLDPTEYDDGTSEYIKHLKSHLGGTGDWIEKTTEYQQWHTEKTSNVLWIKAIAGAGKSVLAARSRARIARREGVPVLHFFFRHIITTNRTPKQLVRDWLAQILLQSPFLQYKLKKDFIEQQRQLDAVTFDTLWSLFRDVVGKLPRVYCFADALDEMSLGNEDFLLRLVELGKLPSCKLFVTSRPVPHIIAGFRKTPSPPLQIVLGPENMNEDISKYVDHRIDHDISRYIDHRLSVSGLRFPNLDPENPTTLIVREVLKRKAQGSFLYARLMTDNLLDAVRKHGGSIGQEELEETLESLPIGLGAMYDGMLKDHASRTSTPWHLQLSILQWVTHSERPLRLLELVAIIDFQQGALQRNKDTKAIVRTSCGPLLEILPSDVVGPIHHSFTEYLTNEANGKPVIISQEAHRAMAEQCIRYLIGVLDEIGNSTSHTEEQVQDLGEAKLKYPFLRYAIQHWDKHIHKCYGIDDELVQLLDTMWLRKSCLGIEWLLSAVGCANPCIWLNDVSDTYDESITAQEFDQWNGCMEYIETLKKYPMTPLHMAARVGLNRYVEHLMTLGYNVEGAICHNETPLYLASEAGWPDVVTDLLRAGAQSDVENSLGLKPLHAAATANCVEVVKLLLDAGVDPWTLTNREHPEENGGYGHTSGGYTPLTYVCRENHLETLRAFIPYLDMEGLIRALRLAVDTAGTELILALIETEKLDLNLMVEDNLIHTLSAQGKLPCIEALLKRGVDPNLPSVTRLSDDDSGDYYSDGRGPDDFGRFSRHPSCLPIHAFARGTGSGSLHPRDIRRGLDMLMQAGNGIEARDAFGQTPLYLARGSYKLTSEILKLGADVRTASIGDITPLHQVTGYTSETSTDLVRLWIEHGVDVNARRTSDGRTALMISLEGGIDDLSIPNLLIEAGADPNIKDRQAWTALHVLACGYYQDKEEGFAALINAGADLHVRNDAGDTVLHLLIVHESHTNSKISGLEFLVKAGMQIEDKNALGETPLLRLAKSTLGTEEKRDRLSKLLELGSRVDARDVNGATCIHHHCSNASYDNEFIESLISAGADPKWLDSKGNNSWHYITAQKQYYNGESAAYKDIQVQGVPHNQENACGQTPFFMAAAQEDTGLIDFLMSNCDDVDVNCADIYGRAAIHIAAARSDTLVRRLIKLGADARARTNNNSTVLHFAAQARQPNILILLLTLIESPLHDLVGVRDGQGRTALDYAARAASPESIEILMRHGATMGDPYLISALHNCAQYGAEELLQRQKLGMLDGWAKVANHEFVMNAIQSEHDEDISRCLGAYVTEFDGKHIPPFKIRQCVKKLIDALQDVEGAIATATPSNTGWRGLPDRRQAQHAPFRSDLLDNALVADCEAMIAELMERVQLLPIAKRESLLENVEFRGSLKLKSIQEKREALIEALKKMDDHAARDSLILGFVTDGHPNLAELVELSSSKVQLGEKDSLHKGSMPELLAEQGYIEALERLLTRVTADSASDSTKSSEAAYNVTPTGSSEISEAANDGWSKLLNNVCCQQSPALPAIKVLLRHHPIPAQARAAALFNLVPGRHAWNVEALEYVLTLGADPNCKNAEGETPLHVACVSPTVWHGGSYCQDTLRCLLKHGADPNILNDAGVSCLPPDLDLLSPLLEHGADVSIGRPSLLSRAVRVFEFDVVKLLIEQGVDLNTHTWSRSRGTIKRSNRRNPYSSIYWNEDNGLCDSYPLHIAARGSWGWGKQVADPELSRMRVIKLLMEGGAEPNLVTPGGGPIVHEAIGSFLSNGLDLFLEHPALNLSQQDSKGNTVLLALASSPRECTAWEFGRLIKLIRRGADIKATNNQGQNIVHLIFNVPRAAESLRQLSDSAEYLELLGMCEENGLTNAADNKGLRPIHYCLAKDLWQIAEHLSFHGADFAEPSSSGDTALHYLARGFQQGYWNFHTESPNQEDKADLSRFIKLLGVDIGIDINACNGTGEPPLFGFIRSCPIATSWAGRAERPASADDRFFHKLHLLTQAGADVHGKASNGQGMLHVVASLTAGRDVQARHVDYYHDDTMLALWQKFVADGLDPYMEDNEQRTPLDIAAISGNTAILELY